MDKKMFLGLPIGAAAVLLLSMGFDVLVETKLDFVSKVILIVLLILIFFLLKAKINPKSGCPDDNTSGAEIYTEVEFELDHEELQKKKEEGEEISPFGRKNLDLKISGEGKVIKKVSFYTFPGDVKFADVETLRQQIGATHATWEDLTPNFTAFPDSKMLVAFGTEGVGENGLKMTACRRGSDPITAIFQQARFQEGTLFPLIIDIKTC